MMEGFEWEPTIEDLRWLERLALALVGDVHEARDLVQSALLAARRGAPAVPTERRRWLSGALRNLAAKGRRSRGRRAQREEMGARSEALPSPEELAVRAEEQQRLLRIVRELPEGYRTPLLLRYYEEASPRDIAAQLDLPLRTVHTRLHRGLKLLRERLDAEHPQGRAGWTAALLPLLPRGGAPSGGEGPPAKPLMGTLPAAALVAGGVALTLLIVLSGEGPSGLGEPSEIGRAGASVTGDDGADLARLDAASGRAQDQDVADTPASLEVLALDWNGRPVGGASIVGRTLLGLGFRARVAVPMEVELGPRREMGARTDASGLAVVAAPTEDTYLQAELPGHVPAIASAWRPGEEDRTPFVAIAPARRLDVSVLDAEGRPVPGLAAWVVLEESAATRFPRAFRRAHLFDWRCTYEGGVVAAPAVPDVPEARLVLQAPGGATRRWALSDLPPAITWPAEGDLRVNGVLVDGAGAPLAGYVIDERGRWVEAASDGAFSMDVNGGTEALWAVAEGREPVRVALATAGREGGLDLGAVELASAAGAVSGRVVDETGRGLGGVTVSLEDPTVCGADGVPLQLESVAAGGSGTRFFRRTGEDGRFTLPGLRT